MGRECSRHERDEKCIRILIGKTEVKKQFGRPRRRWRTILEWILEKYGAKLWTRFTWLNVGTNGWLL